jgi:N utilization substance protein B
MTVPGQAPERTRTGKGGGSARSARRCAREAALQGMRHYREVLHGCIEQADQLRAGFAPFLDRKVAELSPVEHGVLLIGAYELTHRAEIPYRVVINEAVELAKSFGGTDGFRYVNGVLDKLAQQLRPAEAGRAGA